MSIFRKNNMSKPNETLSQRAARLAEPTSKAIVPRIENFDKKPKSPKKPDGRVNNGGARENSGRKPETERKAENRQSFQDFASELISVRLPDAEGNTQQMKMSRTQIARLRLFNNVLKGDMRAIEEFNERTMDKAMQPIGGGDEPIRLRIDI